MISVQIKYDGDRIHEIMASGHANLAPHGQDIVCAAVSAILQHTQLALHEFAIDSHSVTINNGQMTLRFAKIGLARGADIAQILGKSAHNSIKILAKQYPKNIVVKVKKEK